ncbi:hypothetical protein KAR50_05665 [Periweissella fabaria]|uniref:hypothetical protein n=1 Tax=Periweissella fabaria TaxID=546157 RepID=UPI001E333B38|nr:hypothetical protein [Periweissella fabaria]MCM0597329.1 hypothetical protein [Periweissella fabaria]
MIYSVGENIYAFNSGIEFAQVQRTQALNAAKMPAKIITRQYNRFLARNAAWMGLTSADYINMYDYFQKVTNFEPIEQSVRTLASIPREIYHVSYPDSNQAQISEDGRRLANIHMLPGKTGLVGNIEYLNNLGDVMMTAYYDWRGFRSMVETYHPDGSVASQTFYDPAGVQVLAVTFMPHNDESQATSWQLLNYHGKNYTFDSENQLFTFFLNELNDVVASTFLIGPSWQRAYWGLIHLSARLRIYMIATYKNMPRGMITLLKAVIKRSYNHGDVNLILLPSPLHNKRLKSKTSFQNGWFAKYQPSLLRWSKTIRLRILKRCSTLVA